MKYQFRMAAFSAALALALAFVACGGKETVASKSARAFREAPPKSTPDGGHGGHATGEEQATMTGMDHSTMSTSTMDHSTMDHSKMGASTMDHSKMGASTMDHSKMGASTMDHSKMDHSKMGASTMDHSKMGASTMDHSKMDHSKMDHSTMDHSKMGASTMDHSKMDHSKMNMGEQSTSGMDHSRMGHGEQPMTGMDHAGMQHGAAAAPVMTPPPITSSAIEQLRPAATLANDSFDAPAPRALSEAGKSMQGRGDEGMARGITPGQDHENAPEPAPAVRDGGQGNASAPAMDHRQHDQPAAATTYTCPMHPEVTSDKPGTCPKCGMTLVKK